VLKVLRVCMKIRVVRAVEMGTVTISKVVRLVEDQETLGEGATQQ
jgi:hypothetical protein